MKFAAAIISLLAVQLVGAPPPKLVREIGLDQIIQGHPEFTSVALTFSPDDNWIAMVGVHRHFDQRGRRLQVPSGPDTVFMVPRNGPLVQQTGGQQIGDQRLQIDPGLELSGGAVWSPNSDSFFVQGIAGNPRGPNARLTVKLFNLRGEEISRYDGPTPFKDWPERMFGFLDAEHLLAGGMPSTKAAVPLESTRSPREGCRYVDGSKTMEGRGWRQPGLQHLLAVLSDDEASKTLVVDYASEEGR